MADSVPASSRDVSVLPGLKLFGRYELKRQLGQGGMGAVWLARDEKLDRIVALKFLSGEVLEHPVAVERLKRETKHSLSLTHPNIVRIYDFVQDEQHAAIAMEYVEGWSLWAMKVDRANRCFTVEEITPWIQQLCSAVDYAHNAVGIVHRDIKPPNLLIDQRGQLKVTDFGLARNLAATPSPHTTQLPVLGTMGYMSPQQAVGEEPSVLDDVYAIGATIYDLLTGTPPFHKGEIFAQLRESTPPAMAERLHELGVQDVHIPLAWEETVAACLQKEPALRPKSAAEISRRLFTEQRRSEARAVPIEPERPATAGEPQRAETVWKAGSRSHLTYALVFLAIAVIGSAIYVGSKIGNSPAARNSNSSGASVVATAVYTAADDFIVDIYHNGQRVPDAQRKVIAEIFGAMGERIDVTVREGDWLVFNVVNNRLRWNGAYYFAAGGVTADGAAGFVSELETGRWSACDDPADVPRFIEQRDFLSERRVAPVTQPWVHGDGILQQAVKGWNGQPVWGTNRNTWIKFRAVPVKPQ
jgi:serine/threonine protein kinase